jgi:hypothetical protein
MHVLKEATTESDSEKFVKFIWERMDSNERDAWGENDYHSKTPIRLEL